MHEYLLLLLLGPLSPTLYWYAVAGAILFVVAHLVITFRDEGEVSLLHILLGGVGCFVPGINILACVFGLMLVVISMGCYLNSIVVFRAKE